MLQACQIPGIERDSLMLGLTIYPYVKYLENIKIKVKTIFPLQQLVM